jgi:glycyl-tRNA synthetase beta chain
MVTKNLLVELFVEELPPKALKKLGEAFAAGLADGLRAQGLATDQSAVTPFASPRRLAAHISAVRAQADDRSVSQKLMPVSVGLNAEGQATPALLKKLAALGVVASVVAQLQRRMDGKAEALFYDNVVRGASLTEGLQKALDDSLAGLPIPKVMQYQLEDGWTSVNFVRPAHGLVALHGADIVPVKALGLEARRETLGHRFEAPMTPVVLQDADHYARQLEEQGAVIASFAARHGEIARQLSAAARKEGLTPIEDAALLDEVTALVERPNVLLCRFDEEFLGVPPECLILTMKANQKYFPLLDGEGKLTNRFLVVSNIRPDDASRVIEGNERVVRPRLADAKFFFDQDRKKTLESRVAGLDKVVYHAKLGSMGERVERVRRIAVWVANRIGADPELADRAALLAKADLLTDMVGEFPELQGTMGSYYARHDKEDPLVAAAIADQYVVRRGEEEAASNLVGESLLLADRAETLIGIWAIGLKPTGDKDPFALRRNALGLIRSFELCGFAAEMDGGTFELDLGELLSFTADSFTPRIPNAGDAVAEVNAFIFERYSNLLSPGHGVKTLDAVISLAPPLHTVRKRTKAVVEFLTLPEAQPLAAANKRVSNILKKSVERYEPLADDALLKEPAELALRKALKLVVPTSESAFASGDYTASLQALAALKAPVDAFFDTVMVNADDPALRANRLGLLAQLHTAMNRVADLSKLAT